MPDRRIISSEASPPVEWTLVDLASILIRRRVWILGSFAITGFLALVYVFASTPHFRATAVIEVQKQPRGAFGLDASTGQTAAPGPGDSFDDNLTFQTQIGILQSEAVALDVIRRTGLESTPDYFAPHRTHFSFLHRVAFWRQPLEALSVPLNSAPNRRYVALRIFSKHVTIAPANGTRLIAVSYSDPDPGRAAAVVAAILESLSDLSSQSRSSADAQSAAWLQTQLADLRRQTDTLDAQAATLDRQAGAFGDDDAHNVVLTRLDDLNSALSTAQSNRILREAIWHAVQSGDPEVISGLGGNPGAGPNTQNSFALLQTLRAQEAVAQSQIAESANRYGENWPALAEQRAGLATTRKSIQDEIHRLGDRAHSDYQVAQQSENAARDAYNQQRDLASRLTGSAVALRLARQEAGESRNLYTSLLSRLQQTGVLEGLHPTSFTVVTPALVPATDHPWSPNIPLLAALACAGGLAFGCAAALVRELTDNSIHSVAGLESLLEAPVFATLPAADPPRPRLHQWLYRIAPAHSSHALEAAAASDFALPAPASPYVEGLHRLRANLLLSHSEPAPQIILITNAEPKPTPPIARKTHAPAEYVENFPSLALNFAAILAQHGAPTLYVDANLRAAPAACHGPTAHGLTDLLTDESAVPYEHPDATPSLLTVLHSGPRPPCPSELIASARMSSLLARWREQYRFIVVDGPPPDFADALILAQQADAVLLSAQAGHTRRDAILSAFHALSRQVPHHAVLGLVFADAPSGGPHAQA